MALIRKSTFYCNVSQGDIRLFKQTLRSLDSLPQDKLVRAFSRRPTEEAGKVIRTKAGLLSQDLKGGPSS